ncbi:MAG: type II toxin-antitoxin system YafQ family toxin [Solobacterium sp.]|jgi:addiction module toxin, relE/stbE family|nr:type II toxin-antitoxin system YafQ family toxin [Solobacterium sp.]
MLRPVYTNKFKKDYKQAIKRGCDKTKLQEVIVLLCNQTTLPEIFRDHSLTNSRNYKDMRECHIESDWLLVYRVLKQDLILELIRTGTHSDLF